MSQLVRVGCGRLTVGVATEGPVCKQASISLLCIVDCESSTMFISVPQFYKKGLRVEYLFRRAIFGAGMGRDDEHYCDVQSSGVNCFWSKVPSFYFIHWSFIV